MNRAPCLLFLVAAVAAHAQDAFLDAWTAARAKGAPPVQFTISLPKTTYYIGEAIWLKTELAGTGELPLGRFAHKGLTGDTMRVVADRPDAVDPLEGLVYESGGLLVGHGSSLPQRSEVFLNQWLRFSQPGTYRFYAITDAVTRAGTVVSNIVSLEIQRPPAGWAEQRLEQATRTLAMIPGRNEMDPLKFDYRTPAALADLAALETPQSAAEILRNLYRFAGASPSVDGMLLAYPHRAEMLAVMRERLLAPDEPITGAFVATLGALSVMVEGSARGEDKPAAGPDAEEINRRTAEFLATLTPERRRDLEWTRAMMAFRDDAMATLGEALDRKQPGEPLIETLNLFSGVIRYDERSASRPPPAWWPKAVRLLAANLGGLPVTTQRNLLGTRWPDTLHPPGVDVDLVPALRALIAKTRDSQVRGLATQRLAELGANP